MRTSRVRSYALLFVLAAGFLVCSARPLCAAAYIGAGWARQEIGGEFDDTLVLVGVDAIYDIPTIDPGDGLRFVFGFGRESAGVEFSYTTSDHKAPGDLNPSGYDAEYHVYDVHLVGRVKLLKSLTRERARLYFRLGFAVTSLAINGSAYDLTATPFDPVYHGSGFALGSGFEFKLPLGLTPYAEVDYRWIGYGSVSARGQDIDIDDKVSGKGPSFYLGVTWSPFG